MKTLIIGWELPLVDLINTSAKVRMVTYWKILLTFKNSNVSVNLITTINLDLNLRRKVLSVIFTLLSQFVV